MRYGRGACPDGFLPVFSVNSEEEARTLLAATCPLGPDKEYYSRELAVSQDLDTLEDFSQKLERTYNLIYGNKANNRPQPARRSAGKVPRPSGPGKGRG